MLTFNFTFVPFDMNGFYKQCEDEYKRGWIDKQDLQRDVVQDLIPADKYKEITGENYEEPKKVSE